MRRLFVDTLKAEFVIEGSDAKHLLYAMRVKAGQHFTVVDKQGKVADAEVAACTKDTVQMHLVAYMENADTEPPIDIIVAQCLPKADKMDYIVQKAVELGANQIVPISSSHCVVKYDAKKKQLRRQKWQKIADEAAKQCGRTSLPQIAAVTDLKSFLQACAALDDTEKLVCYEAEIKQSLKEVLREAANIKYIMLIGPEGGFASEEIKLCQEAGFKSVTLGTRILRTETASLAALSVIMYEKGDL